MPQHQRQEPSTNTKAHQTASNVHNESNSTTMNHPNQSTTLSKPISHSQQVNGATAQSTLPKTGESSTNTPLYVGLLALILGVGSLSLKRVITKMQ
ncbi:LPXTG cell wall anchor domain-containing protein [Staphylococcus sp. Marseille-Q1834]|uniref:LPXTG cell wall anchor domain-containing protein n=1 Tax=Staphylococcus sp. Marseille-Q1834 TaxID=2866594 RepID=UPI001CF8399B|nr:LPXTG cell wall anchor domain-containing protein [Staphylococcus sp. Marseille-Q1834]